MSETLDRIQQEIKEALEREEELKKGYARLNSFNSTESLNNGYGSPAKSVSPVAKSPPNGFVVNGQNGFSNNSTNGHHHYQSNGTTSSSNGFRRFTPNPSSKGVMQKFLKMRGKVGLLTVKPFSNNSSPQNGQQPQLQQQHQQQTNWAQQKDDVFEPAKVTIEPGKALRNGYVPAEEKMRRELLEFQLREAELRKERRKSQPDLMAALEAEAETETNLKPARSMVQMYSTEDLTEETYSAPASLKPARSLAALCDASDNELETPGTHSLILQFESLKNQERA